MNTFEECCEYLGISKELPKCQIDERQIQAAYKLRVCMIAWNKQDDFVPDEMANNDQVKYGCTPCFYLKNGKLLPSDNATFDSYVGIVYATYPAANSYMNTGLRLSLKTFKRAVSFGKTFIETFNELI